MKKMLEFIAFLVRGGKFGLFSWYFTLALFFIGIYACLFVEAYKSGAVALFLSLCIVAMIYGHWRNFNGKQF